ncbi:CdaR family transcriptional regulator [Virgibacillus byunsanensis]|uniref:CdaR family transcriptional regulator n=1 Tax=Virgibacillus byunsanensis TaxID=570945 RepID=A0ABW3LQZ3_9BACI
MEGFVQFAQNTVKAVSEIISFPISVSNEKGYILGDTDPTRFGTLHKPSIEVINANEVILFTAEKASRMENVLPGVAVPLNFDGRPVGVLGIIGDPIEVESYAHLVKKYVEMMWQETLHLQVENLESMTLESFVQYILLNRSVNQEQLNHYCKLLHIKANCNRICITIDIGDSFLKNVQNKHHTIAPNRFKKALLDCVVRAFDNDPQNVCAFLNTERIVFLKYVNGEDGYFQFMEEFRNRSLHLLEMFQVYNIHNAIVASGNIASSIEDMDQSYRESDSIINYGNKLDLTPKILTYYDWDILLEMLPNHIDAKMGRMLVQRLRPLLHNEAYPVLKRDFLTYCINNMNVSKAAKELFIHRNTLIYRLKKIDIITGLDTGRFDHCTLLCFALKEDGNVSQQSDYKN